jgi:hypothetical protein
MRVKTAPTSSANGDEGQGVIQLHGFPTVTSGDQKTNLDIKAKRSYTFLIRLAISVGNRSTLFVQ